MAERDESAHKLGANIRALRHSHGMTLAALAQQIGRSHSFLSQVERGKAHPSMETLTALAHILGASEIELLFGSSGDNQALPATLLRSSERVQGTYGRLSSGQLLAHNSQSTFTPLIVGGDSVVWGEPFEHREDEFLYVMVGSVEVDLGDAGLFTFTVGDSVYIRGGVSHRWRSSDGNGFQLFVVKEHFPDIADAEDPYPVTVQRNEQQQ